MQEGEYPVSLPQLNKNKVGGDRLENEVHDRHSCRELGKRRNAIGVEIRIGKSQRGYVHDHGKENEDKAKLSAEVARGVNKYPEEEQAHEPIGFFVEKKIRRIRAQVIATKESQVDDGQNRKHAVAKIDRTLVGNHPKRKWGHGAKLFPTAEKK